jgi:hypothetical protein
MAGVSIQNGAWWEEPDSAEEHFVDITPHPIFARLKGLNYRVPRGVKMFRGVVVWRRITATHMSTRQTKSQVNPGSPHLQTFLAAFRARNDVFADLIKMSAGAGAHDLPSVMAAN